MKLNELDALKAKLDALRPLPQAALRNLHDELVLRWTYNSNAIEGNTLTLMETKVVLEGITVGGKLIARALRGHQPPRGYPLRGRRGVQGRGSERMANPQSASLGAQANRR